MRISEAISLTCRPDLVWNEISMASSLVSSQDTYYRMADHDNLAENTIGRTKMEKEKSIRKRENDKSS